jgi:PAS domain S-box-containing protein
MSEPETARDWGDLLQRALAVSSEPILVLDEETRILAASLGAAQLLGRPREQLTGLAVSQLIFPPPDIASFRLPIQLHNERPLELELQHVGGGLIPVEAHCDVFDDPAGHHCILVIHDLRQSELAEQERAARLAKLSLLNQLSEALHGAQLTLDQILEAVLICVTAGQGLRFNRAFLLLLDEQAQELRGEIAIGPSNREEAARIWSNLANIPIDIHEMVTQYDVSLKQTDVVVNEIVRSMRVSLEDERHILVRAMRERQPFRVAPEDLDLPGAEQLRAWLKSPAFAVAPLTTRRGPVGVLVADNAISGREITALDLEFLQLFANKSANAIENSRLYHELERRLLDLRRATERQKRDQELLLRMERLSVMGETSAIVAHELRNPLVAIGGFARTLQRNLPDHDPNKQYAAIITDEVERLERIIHDLLDFIRPQKLLRKSVRLDELVNETIQRFTGEMAARKITLRQDLQAGTITVNVNPGEIRQVLQNLLMNGIQAMVNPGTLEVRTRVLEGGVQVEVLDEGPGVPPDLLEKVFIPFFTTKASGSGLGLTICAQILKAHGGTLTVTNRPEGGAAFRFILPRTKTSGGSE